ncbi:unnamed protein product [Sphacelaria rigidula]
MAHGFRFPHTVVKQWKDQATFAVHCGKNVESLPPPYSTQFYYHPGHQFQFPPYPHRCSALIRRRSFLLQEQHPHPSHAGTAVIKMYDHTSRASHRCCGV